MNPINLQTIQLMTSIISSEKVPEDIKVKANLILNNMLTVVLNDSEEVRKAYSNLVV